MHKAAAVSRYAAHILIWLVVVSFLSLAASAAQRPPAKAGDYIGSDACSDCHFAEFQQLQKNPMAVLLSDKYPVEQRGCEACHGPGRQHASSERIKKGEHMTEEDKAKAATMTEDEKEKASLEARRTFNLSRRSPKEKAAICLACHEKDEKENLFHRSRHAGAGVTCYDCHDPHLLKEGEGVAKPSGALESYFSLPQRPAERDWLNNRLLRQNQPQLCYSCHREIEAEFRLPVRHRVNEGLVKCTDCHNPHGRYDARELNGNGTEQVCYSCHVEKRGPFVYEHASVRVEGCNACHTPHGSINVHLLKRREERQLCLECHVAPQAINVPHPKPNFRIDAECTRCHIEIHGSNYQPQFLR